MNGGVALVIEVDPMRAERRMKQGFLDELADSLDDALARAEGYLGSRTPRSIGLIANAAAVLPELVRRGVRVDVVTDQTSAHDPLDGYVPDVPHVGVLRINDPAGYIEASRASIAKQCEAIVALKDRGSIAFDYGNNLRGEAQTAGFARAFDYPGFVPAYIRPLFERGRGPFRWVALSGDPKDIIATDRAVLELFPEDRSLRRWIELAEQRVPFQGLPARVCWLGVRRAGGIRRAHRRPGPDGEARRADRHRPRSPRLGLGRLTEPRDGGDARRERRDRGLADPQRVGEHRGRCDLGLGPSRRGRRHR